MTPISKEIGGYINRFTGANQRGIDGEKDMNQHLAHVANTTYGCDKKKADGCERQRLHYIGAVGRIGGTLVVLPSNGYLRGRAESSCCRSSLRLLEEPLVTPLFVEGL